MNFTLPEIPDRSSKPRQVGLTMMMDKGLSIRETEDFIETCSTYTDLVKFGFGTSVITNKLSEKIKLYNEAGIKPYFGGTLFEAFIIREKYDDFVKIIEKYGLDTIEISDGSISIPHEQKLEYISKLSKKFTVLSEVGSKQKNFVIPPDKWIAYMKSELESGSTPGQGTGLYRTLGAGRKRGEQGGGPRNDRQTRRAGP